jgi:hypothetical protein
MRLGKRIMPVVRYAEELGFKASRTGGGHLKFSRPGYRSVFASYTPSDWRSVKNIKSELRRAVQGH